VIAAISVAACNSETQRATPEAEAAGSNARTPLEGGVHQRVSTAHGPLHLWTPGGYSGRGDIVVYVHGNRVNVDQAWTNHRLASQFAASEIDAMFIVCEAPATDAESVSWVSLSELLGTAERASGQVLPSGRVAVVGHSAAHRTVLPWLDESQLDTLVLVDAVYGDVDRWAAWAKAKDDRRLIFVGEDTREWADQLAELFPEATVLDRMPAQGDRLPTSRIVYIKSDVGHFQLASGGVALPALLRLVPVRDEGMPVSVR
jgi:hypothetical protein